jgi:hypothetical protein
MPDITEIEQYFKDKNINIEDLRNIAYQLQKNNDILKGGLRSSNIKSFRTIDTFNAQDSLDATYPMYLHLNITEDMTKIVSIKLSFWLLPFRAYDKSAASGGGSTTVSGGGSTTVSGGGSTTPSGGGGTSQSTSGYYPGILVTAKTNVTNVGNEHASGALPTAVTSPVNFAHSAHTHPTPNHTHTTPNHQHATPNTQHATPDHAHDITFGIYEESNSPTIGLQISKDNSKTYGSVLGNYTTDTINLEIKDYITTAGSFVIKFTSSARARLSAQLTVKLDIKAR